ncbi:MAG: hypothetical protein WBD71_15555, partial [Xanthobacteraceae bacterium]
LRRRRVGEGGRRNGLLMMRVMPRGEPAGRGVPCMRGHSAAVPLGGFLMRSFGMRVCIMDEVSGGFVPGRVLDVLRRSQACQQS